MFSSTILKGALCALAVMDMQVEAATSADDIAQYGDFAAVMSIEGFNYEWKSYPITT